MTYIGELADHRPLASEAPICLYDHETWPCTVQQIRSQVAAAIEKAAEDDAAYRPKWLNGMIQAADVARGPHGT